MPALRHAAAVLAAIATLVFLFPVADAANIRTPTKVQSGEHKIGALVPSINASALVAQLAGTGVTLSNARYTGSAKAVGSFTGAASSVGVDSGVVLSTGDILELQGPNNNDSTSTDLQQPGDSALELDRKSVV